MGYQRIVIYVLLFIGNDTSVQGALCTLASEIYVGLVTCHSVMQRYDVMIEVAVTLLLYIHIAYAGVLGVSLLHTV